MSLPRCGSSPWSRERGSRLGDPIDLRAPLPASPTISVVIPARDEGDRIGPLLDALSGAPGVDEIVVVDDGSSDGTAALALSSGARVVPAGPPPPGWAGKAWALDRGVRSATGAWIVCLDADTRPSPELPRWLVARARHDRLDLASVSGVADLRPAARWLHASMLATLVYRFGGPGATGRSLGERSVPRFPTRRVARGGRPDVGVGSGDRRRRTGARAGTSWVARRVDRR